MIRAITCLVFCLTSSLALGQSYEFGVGDASVAEGNLYTQDISLSVTADFSVSGWSYSVCHDSALSDVCGADSSSFTLFLAFGSPLFFESTAIDDRATVIPGSTDGASQGIVIDQGGIFFFPSDSTEVVAHITYVADTGTSGMTSTTSICSTVGNPPVEAVVVCCGGSSVPLSAANVTAVDGTVTYGAADPQFSFGGDDATVTFDSMTGVAASTSLSVDVNISNGASNTDFAETAGFAISLTHDGTFLTPTAVNLGSIPAAIVQNTENVPGDIPAVFNCDSGVAGNMGADIVMTNITGTGVSIAVLNTDAPSAGPPPLPYCLRLTDFGTNGNACSVDYTVDTTSLMGALTASTTTLAFADAGDGVGNSVKLACTTTGGFNFSDISSALATNDITITLAPLVDLAFVRGDCNDDGQVNIADAVWIISGYLAMPTVGSEGPCAEACDANESGAVDVADVSYILSYRFSGGPAPTSPFPDCAAVSGAPCDAFSSCAP